MTREQFNNVRSVGANDSRMEQASKRPWKGNRPESSMYAGSPNQRVQSPMSGAAGKNIADAKIRVLT